MRLRALRFKVLTVIAAILLTSTAFGLISSYLSPIIPRDIPTINPAINLSIEGVPENASAGDVFLVTATMKNNANRPAPAVLRFEVRNGDGIGFEEVTVYADCGAEERVTSKTLIYYIGRHGPLLAPNGSHFPQGTTVAEVEASLGEGAQWQVVLREIRMRDPLGYEELIDPGFNASSGPVASSSQALKALYYYGMVSASDGSSQNPADWTLIVALSDTVVATGGNSTDGFLMEISLDAQGSYNLKFWAERPDGLGIPNHAWKCEPL
ncbi:MAG: hypothetical protein LN412_05115 [Candidatus Thermoplasmatota archaeon]|nr:hypothetical protein [Candidatus Thermoplasmatota archaeon]